MDIFYSNHSKKRMKQRGIEEWEIEHIVNHPTYTKRNSEGKIEAVAEIKNRNVKIVYIKESYV